MLLLPCLSLATLSNVAEKVVKVCNHGRLSYRLARIPAEITERSYDKATINKPLAAWGVSGQHERIHPLLSQRHYCSPNARGTLILPKFRGSRLLAQTVGMIDSAREHQQNELLTVRQIISDCNLSNSEQLDVDGETWLEIGFGMGEHLAAQMKMNKHVQFIGVEPALDGIEALWKLIEATDLQRLRVFPKQVQLLLPRIPDESLSRIFLLFPNPRQRKRSLRRLAIQGQDPRLLQASFVRELVSKLKPGGLLRVGTDREAYAEHMQDLWNAEPRLEQVFGPSSCEDPSLFLLRPPEWPSTLWEQRMLRKGRRCTYFELMKI